MMRPSVGKGVWEAVKQGKRPRRPSKDRDLCLYRTKVHEYEVENVTEKTCSEDISYVVIIVWKMCRFKTVTVD